MSFLSPSVQQPKPRDLAGEMLQTYMANAQTAQPYFNIESFFQPRYQQIDLQKLQQQLFGYDVPGQPGSQTGTQQAGGISDLVARGGSPGVGSGGLPQPGQQQGAPIYNARGRLLGYNQPNTLRIPRPQGGAVLFQDPYAAQPGPSQTPGHHPGTLELGSAANTFTRGRDIADVARYGPEATSAFLAANPFLASGLTNLLGRTQDSPILQTLNQQAQAGLAQGGQLSPQEARAADQNARAAYAARGLATSEPAAAAEILNRDAAVRQRLAAAQQLASGVQGLNQQQADLVGRASQIFSTTLSDPFQAILGRTSGAGGGGAGGGYPQLIGSGAKLFDPLNPYAQDVYNTNYNASAATNIANANAQSAATGAGIGAIGSIIAAVLPALFASDERIKANVKRTGKKTPSGIPIKTWTYKTDPKKRKYRGVMAQDVEKVSPFAVITDPVSGLKAVNYAMTDSPFELVRAGLALRKAA